MLMCTTSWRAVGRETEEGGWKSSIFQTTLKLLTPFDRLRTQQLTIGYANMSTATERNVRLLLKHFTSPDMGAEITVLSFSLYHPDFRDIKFH